MKYCKNCGRTMGDEFAFCPSCGTAAAKCCESCGSELRGDEAFCPACGAAVPGTVRPAGNPVEPPVTEPVVSPAAAVEGPAIAPNIPYAENPAPNAPYAASPAPATMADYERAINCSLLCVLISAVLLIAAVAVWWFVNIYVGYFLCLAGELIALIPNTRVQRLFKKANSHIADKKQRKTMEKALRKDLKKKNGAYCTTFVTACVCLAVLIILVLVTELLPCMIGSSSNNQGSVEQNVPSLHEQQELLPDIAEAFEMTDRDAERVKIVLFDRCDSAFADLEKNATDEELREYADQVDSAFFDFINNVFSEKRDLLSEKIDNTSDAEEKEKYHTISENLSLLYYEYYPNLIDKLQSSASGEECAEAAFALVNKCSNFFYGVPWITEEQLDSLG